MYLVHAICDSKIDHMINTPNEKAFLFTIHSQMLLSKFDK